MSDEQAVGDAETAPARGLPARVARTLAVLTGALAGGAVLLFASDAPWWMAPFAFLVVGAVVLRLLRPMPRQIGWVDEA